MADDWYTPKVIFDALNVTFDLDVCSPQGGTGIVPAAAYYTIEDDCLTKQWEGFVWMNPPYSNPKPFVEKFLDHGNGIALVPMAKSKWFHTIWDRAHGVMPAPVNLKFIRPEGGETQIMFNTALVGMGKKAINAMQQSNLGRIR